MGEQSNTHTQTRIHELIHSVCLVILKAQTTGFLCEFI